MLYQGRSPSDAINYDRRRLSPKCKSFAHTVTASTRDTAKVSEYIEAAKKKKNHFSYAHRIAHDMPFDANTGQHAKETGVLIHKKTEN